MPDINPLPVSSRTREKLQEVKSEGESYDDLLQRLVLTQHRADLSARYHEVAGAELEELHDLDDLEPQPMRDDTPEEPTKGVGKPAVDEDPTDRPTHRRGGGDTDTSDEGPSGDSADGEDRNDADDGESDEAASDDGGDAGDVEPGADDGETRASEDDGEDRSSEVDGESSSGDGDDSGETDEAGPFGGSAEGADDE